MATKKQIHPGIDLGGLDPRAVDRLLEGQPFTVSKQIQRGGRTYEPGDEIVLGDYKNDDILLRRNAIGGRFAVLPDQYAYGKWESARQGYERKTLQEPRNQVSWLRSDFQAACLLVDSLNAKLTGARAEKQNLKEALAAAEKKLAELEAAAPKLEDFLPKNGAK